MALLPTTAGAFLNQAVDIKCAIFQVKCKRVLPKLCLLIRNIAFNVTLLSFKEFSVSVDQLNFHQPYSLQVRKYRQYFLHTIR